MVIMKRKNKTEAIVNAAAEAESDVSSDDLSDDAAEEDMSETELHSEQVSESMEPATKKTKLSKAYLYKPPTNSELNELKETENLFHSSLFRLQITELLSEVGVKDKWKKQIDAYLPKLKDILEKLPEQKERNVSDQQWASKKNVSVPIIQKPFEVQGKFRFLPPTSVKVIGSYILGTCIRSEMHIDIALQIPSECIQSKDYLNHRYLRKRALYLTQLAILLGAKDIGDLAFTYHHGNHMKPILIITPPGKLGHHVRIQIHTWVDTDALKLGRFHIHKNNVRSSWFEEQRKDSESTDDPTPHHNSAVLQDLVLLTQLEVAHSVLADADGVKDGLTLLKVWLHQRELSTGFGGFTNFIMTMYVVHLMQQRKLNKSMSSYQVFRNALANLSLADWTEKGISMARDPVDPQAPALTDFLQTFDVTFVDSSGYLNLCSAMTKNTLARVKHEASLSLRFLETPGLNGFDALFMKPVPFITCFDQFMHITDLAQCVSDDFLPPSKYLDHGGSKVRVLVPALCNLMQKTIGWRVKLAAPKLQLQKEWSLDENPPDPDDCQTSFGFLLDPDKCSSIVDKGPPADSSEAKEFRTFWGQKSEMRRFQDGSICEAVVWKANTLAGRRSVIKQVLLYILNKSAGIRRQHIKFVGPQLDSLLAIPALRGSKPAYDTGEEQLISINEAYDKLAKILRNLPDLPLAIHTIQGTSAALRGADTFAPLVATAPSTGKLVEGQMVPLHDKPCPQYVPSLTVQCILEATGKWPEDAAAVLRLKAAFHADVADKLSSKHLLPTAVYPDHVLVLNDGYVFRVQIGYLREITLLKMKKTSEGMLKMVETEEAQSLEREIVALPKLSSALHGLHKEHASYSPAVRLAKRWVSSQLLADYIPEEAIEFLMAHVYIQSAPFEVPGSPIVAFLRWLQLVGHHDWNTAPITVNLNSELSRENYKRIESHFTKNRKTLPVMFIATPFDQLQSMWTKHKPSVQLLLRLILLCKESLATLQAQLLSEENHLDYKLAFRPPLNDYDVLIHLDKKVLPRRYLAVDATKDDKPPKVVRWEDAHDNIRRHLPVVNFNPVQAFLRELREAFDELALFFYDPLGGDYIAVLWKVPSFQPHDFKVSHLNAKQVKAAEKGDDIKLVPNVEAIIEDIKVIGKGIVSEVEKRK